MSKPINVYDKYSETKKDSMYSYEAPKETAVIEALRFKKKLIWGGILAVFVGLGVLALFNLKVALVVGLSLLTAGLALGVVLCVGKIIDAAYDHHQVLKKAERYGVMQDD